jgi:heat shock protein HtpX
MGLKGMIAMTVFTNGLKTAFLLALMIALCLGVGEVIGGRNGLVIGFAFGGIGALVSYFFSDKIALMSVGAQPLSREEHPQLYDIVERLSQRAGIPMPRLYWSPEQAPNAFATGRNPSNGVVCVTDGCLKLMNDREIEGVLGHELAHVKHRDILISTIAAIIAGGLAMVARMELWFGGGRNNRDSGNPILALLVLILAPIAAVLIQLAISRSREYAADASGSYYAGGPEGLISALRKLEVANGRIPMNVSPAQAHMFIVQPMCAIGSGMMGLFSTHPPVEKRIAKLIQQMREPNPYAA